MSTQEEKFKDYLKELKRLRYDKFSLENFYMPANEGRYQEYLNDYLLKYVQNKEEILDHVVEAPLEEPSVYAGMFMGNTGLYCHVPERKNLFHEMLCLHEIAHLIHYYGIGFYEYNAFSEVVPYFNEYEYLKNINEAYAKLYEVYRKSRAIYAAHNLDRVYEDTVNSHVLAYKVLENRKDDYDIDELNIFNSVSMDLSKKLIRKKYTI